MQYRQTMMRTSIYWTAIALLLFAASGAAEAQSAHRYLRKGNQAYEKQDYSAAELHYRKSLEEKPTSRGNFNLGNAIYQQERYEEAVRRFDQAARQAEDDGTRADALHNLGNAHFQAQELEKSIEAYKGALRLRPNDQSTKFNLAQAQRQLNLQQQQAQQRQQQQDREQQGENQEQQQSQPPQDGQDQPQGQGQDQQDRPNEPQSQDQPRDGRPGERQPLSPEEAQRLLDIVQQEELKVLEKMKKESQGEARRRAKDW